MAVNLRRDGEAQFRDGERRVIGRLMDGRPKVIGTVGGAFINDATRALILADATAIWLDAPAGVLAERVSRRDTRPLLRGKNVDILNTIRDSRDLSDDTAAKLKSVVEGYAKTLA